MEIDAYIDQIIRVVKFNDEDTARRHIALLMQAFAESIGDAYSIETKNRLSVESVASSKRTRL